MAPADANGQPSFANITGYTTPADGVSSDASGALRYRYRCCSFNATHKVKVNGDVRIEGNVSGSGLGVVGSDKYVTRTYQGGGPTSTFATTLYPAKYSHTSNSVLVFLNGVAQIGGSTAQTATGTANYHVASHAVTFADPPLSANTVHIIELPL